MVIRGIVQSGSGKAGNYYGVPTANIVIPASDELSPGVYVGKVKLPDDSNHKAVICLGAVPCPTGIVCEVHVLDWNGDLYAQTIEVEFVEKISELVPFESEEQMKKKIADDLRKARSH